jgi:proteasome lid subunit RPN8/RPN11
VTDLAVPAAILDAMLGHCRAGLPNEACGILAGAGRVTRHVPMRNAEQSPHWYRFDPAAQLAAYADLDTAGLDVLAVYHSHPTSSAYPSQADVELAVPDVVQVIVSLRGAEPRVRAFRITTGAVGELLLRVV